MKIAHIVCSFPPYKGGIGNVAYYEARELTRLGNEVVVFTVGREKGCEEGFKVFNLKSLIKFGNAAFLPQLLWKLKSFDIVQLHYPYFGTQEVVWLARKLGLIKKLVIYYHMDFIPKGIFFNIFSLPSRIIFKSLIKSADNVFVSTKDYASHLRVSKYMDDKFVELPFGTDLKEVGDGEERVVLFVGGMDSAHNFKGVDILLKAFSGIVKKYDDWKLKLVGSGDLKDDYVKLAKELGLRDKVEFMGRLEDEELNIERSKCAFGVMPSINSSEAFGLVLVEVMVYGKPVIASDLPGVRTVARDAGLLCNPGNVKDLSEKMLELIENKELREKLGRQARENVEKKYCWRDHGNKLNEIYEDLCSCSNI